MVESANRTEKFLDFDQLNISYEQHISIFEKVARGAWPHIIVYFYLGIELSRVPGAFASGLVQFSFFATAIHVGLRMILFCMLHKEKNSQSLFSNLQFRSFYRLTRWTMFWASLALMSFTYWAYWEQTDNFWLQMFSFGFCLAFTSATSWTLACLKISFFPFIVANLLFPAIVLSFSNIQQSSHLILHIFLGLSYSAYCMQIGMDIRKQALNLASANSREKNEASYYRQIIDSVPGLVSILDHEARYVVANQKILDQLKMKEADVIGRPIGFSGDSQFRKSILEFANSDRATDQMQVQLAINSDPRWYLIVLSKITERNQISIVSIDIDDRIKAEKQSHEQAALLQSSSQMAAVGQFAASIAHEINNPLAIISLKANQSKRRLTASVEQKVIEAVSKDLDKIEETSYRIAKIVKGLKGLSRNPDLEEPTNLKLTNLVEDALVFCEEKMKHGQITFKKSFSDDFQINARPTHMSQIILNLIGNSIDAIKTQEDLNRWIEVGGNIQNGLYRVWIKDSGPGISEEIATKLLTPFFTTKPIGEGTGLGLSISRKILREMGGDLTLDRTDANTLFVLSWPVQPVSFDKIQNQSNVSKVA